MEGGETKNKVAGDKTEIVFSLRKKTARKNLSLYSKVHPFVIERARRMPRLPKKIFGGAKSLVAHRWAKGEGGTEGEIPLPGRPKK